jgi:hypothetical protein
MESQEEVEITEKDVVDMMDLFTKVPPLMLKMVISRNSNVVKRFESQINNYKGQISDSDTVKIEKVMEMPISELQEILRRAYEETHQKQLKILADPKAEPFIQKNLQELKKVLE